MKETFIDAVCRLAKEGYEIRIYQHVIPEDCVIRLEKDGSSWTRIVPYELLKNGDNFVVYILNLLDKSMKQNSDWPDYAFRE